MVGVDIRGVGASDVAVGANGVLVRATDVPETTI
jgi:hypothetical protein